MMDLDAKLSCTGCGYDLMGVGREGRCPECGQVFDVTIGKGVTKRSSATESHERGDRVMYLVKLWGMLSLAVICVGLGGLRSLVSGEPGPMALGVLVGGLFGFGALATWFTEKK